MHYTIEAIWVGVGLVVVGLAVSYTMISLTKTSSEYPQRDDWFKMAVALFTSGVLFHVLAEVGGVNRWYCKNGDACRGNRRSL